MSKVQICVSVDEAHLAQIQQIAEQLQSLGMIVEQTLSSIGVINGSIQSEQCDNLTNIEGVKDVEPQQIYQLNPPNSDIQ